MPKQTTGRKRCKWCFRLFKNKGSLATHVSTTHQTRCCYCGRDWGTPEALRDHKERMHHPETKALYEAGIWT